MRKKLREYRIELTALVALILGIFLIVERFEIRKYVRSLFSDLGIAVQSGWDRFWQGLASYLQAFTVSDLLGFALILIAVSFIVWRIRVRFLRSSRWLMTVCPRCGSPVTRVHRTKIDRLLGNTLLPQSRRYRCNNPECGWSGLRHSDPHRHHRLDEDEIPTASVQGTPEL